MRNKLLFLFFLLTCTPSPRPARFISNLLGTPQVFTTLPIHWAFDCEFPQEMRSAAREGFEYWNSVLQQYVFIETKDCGGISLGQEEAPRVFVVYVNEDNEKASILATTEVGMLDFKPHSGVLRYYKLWANYDSFESKASVARHEVGHVLGLDHSSMRDQLMFPTLDMDAHKNKAKRASRFEQNEVKKYYQERLNNE